MIAHLAVILMTQAQGKAHVSNGSKFASKELDPKTRPIVEVPEFKGMKFVTVSAYKAPNQETKKIEMIHVFRVTYRADFKAEVEKWKKIYSKDGWKEDVDQTRMLVTRDLKHPKVVRQGLVLHKGKAVFDPKSRARTRTENIDGWVWVSFNEIVKDHSW